MYLKKMLQNITIKQANVITATVIFAFSLVFVGLLVEEMYKDYGKALEENINSVSSQSVNNILREQKAEKLKALSIKTTLVIVTLSFIIFAISLGFYKILNALLQSDTQIFLEFFESAAHKEHVLIPQMIFFKDFRVMVSYINEMLCTINEQKKSLIELNLGLEDKIKEKTITLEESNRNLEKEKIFSQELLKSQKEFLRYAVHETNTPLSVILTSIELYTLKNKKDRQLSKIESAVKNIFSIYDDLSYLVKKDQIEYPKSVINLDKYILSRIDFFTEVAEHSFISFEYLSSVRDAHIYFNETKLQRIIDNTLTNAIKYTLPKHNVSVTLEQVGTFVEFSVGSKSKIIKDVDKVFDAYYREDEKNNDRYRQSFGLGLKLVRNICEEEDVRVSVNSNEKSTVFSYRFKMMGE